MNSKEVISYASIDRIENGIATLEIEQNDTFTNDNIPFGERKTFMSDISLQSLINTLGNVKEGDVLLVSHNSFDSKITPLSKCETEYSKRVEFIKSLLCDA